jgi:hypothetical protein
MSWAPTTPQFLGACARFPGKVRIRGKSTWGSTAKYAGALIPGIVVVELLTKDPHDLLVRAVDAPSKNPDDNNCYEHGSQMEGYSELAINIAPVRRV